MGHQVQKVDCECVIWVLAKSRSWKMFLGFLPKLGNCYNSPIGTKSSLDLDLILTRNLLIWSQTRYPCATKSGNSQLHNRDLWVFVLILSARCHFGPIKTLSRNNQFHWKPSDRLSWCAFASEKEIKAHYFSAILLAKIQTFQWDITKILFWVQMKRLLKKRSPRFDYGSSSSKGWLCMCDWRACKT